MTRTKDEIVNEIRSILGYGKTLNREYTEWTNCSVEALERELDHLAEEYEDITGEEFDWDSIR